MFRNDVIFQSIIKEPVVEGNSVCTTLNGQFQVIAISVASEREIFGLYAIKEQNIVGSFSLMNVVVSIAFTEEIDIVPFATIQRIISGSTT